MVKDDQETAIIDLAREVARYRGEHAGTGIKHSAVGDSDSNGTIERAIQEIEGQCRTMRSALESRIGQKITLQSPITPWLIRHTGYLVTRCKVLASGRTAFQLMKGRRSNGRLAEFGEVVHFLIPKAKDLPGKFEDRWSKGVWVGCDMWSGEHLIGMDNGVFKVHTIRSKTEDAQRSSERIATIRGTPGQPVPGQAYSRTPTFARRFGQAPRAHESFVQQPQTPITVRAWSIKGSMKILTSEQLQDVLAVERL